MGSKFKTRFCWWPVRLARHIKDPDSHISKMEFIGWVWLQRADLVHNMNHGWVCFLDSVPYVPKCKTCGQPLPDNQRGK